MKAFIAKGIMFESEDVQFIIENTNVSIGIEIPNAIDKLLVKCDKIYVDGDFNKHDLITVQLGSLSNGLEPEDINCYSHFEIDVYIIPDEDPHLTIKDRNFKLEDLSIDLQTRIVKVANEMYDDKMKIND